LPGQAPGLSWQNLLNSPGEAPPVVPVPVVVPEPVVVPGVVAPPVPAPLWGVVPVVLWGVVPVLVDEGVDDWSVDVVWSLEDEAVWSAELELDGFGRAAVPSGKVRFGTDAGTTSWLELSLPQALTPSAAMARSASRYFGMAGRG
jgi:hypothetical protein